MVNTQEGLRAYLESMMKSDGEISVSMHLRMRAHADALSRKCCHLQQKTLWKI